MTLRLYFHPLSHYCQKALIALYENDTPFTPQVVDLGDPAERAAFLKVWPLGKFPVLRDEARGVTVPESNVIIEYLALHYPGPVPLVPDDPEQAWNVRRIDRLFDLHISLPMQKIVTDRIRPAGQHDRFGIEDARKRLAVAYDVIDVELGGRTWAAGETFSLADCGAGPTSFYAAKVQPFADTHRNLAAYFDRIANRPSYARALREAEPYFNLFPQQDVG